jgi:hypothetical protein
MSTSTTTSRRDDTAAFASGLLRSRCLDRLKIRCVAVVRSLQGAKRAS